MSITNQNPKMNGIFSEMAEVAGYLWQRGWSERNAGNISINISKLFSKEPENIESYPFIEFKQFYPGLSGKYFLVSGTGTRMRDLAKRPAENTLIIKIGADGNGYHIISQTEELTEKTMLSTSELPAHLSIHQMIINRNSSEKVVMHAHTTELIALTQIKEFCNEDILNKTLWGMHPETAMFVPEGVGFVPYVTSGTEDIAVETLKALQNHQVALWEKHGVFAIGDTLSNTFDTIDILAKSAKIFFLVSNTGYQPEGFDDKELIKLRKLGKGFL